MFDPRKEITELKELAEKGETHASELLKRLVALIHKMIHHEGERQDDVPGADVPPPNADPIPPTDAPPVAPDVPANDVPESSEAAGQ